MKKEYAGPILQIIAVTLVAGLILMISNWPEQHQAHHNTAQFLVGLCLALPGIIAFIGLVIWVNIYCDKNNMDKRYLRSSEHLSIERRNWENNH